MTEAKNLKVAEEIHERLTRRRKLLGVKQQTLTEALLLEGLKLTDSEIQQAVVRSQLITQQKENTSEELSQQKQKSLSPSDE